MPDEATTYTTGAAAFAAAMPVHKVQRWTRSGYLRRVGHGRAGGWRRFGVADCYVLAIANTLAETLAIDEKTAVTWGLFCVGEARLADKVSIGTLRILDYGPSRGQEIRHSLMVGAKVPALPDQPPIASLTLDMDQVCAMVDERLAAYEASGEHDDEDEPEGEEAAS